MEAVTQQQSFWAKSKVLVKVFIIGFMALLLMIPTFLVRDLIAEREKRQKEAIAEVSSKWAGQQNITGPILVLPFVREEGDSSKKLRVKHFAHFLPDELNINAAVMPQEKHRGIYKVMLYTANIKLTGRFGDILPAKLNIAPENILWNEAFVTLHLSDVNGLNDELKLNWNNQILSLAPQTSGGSLNGMQSTLSLTNPEDLKNVPFSAEINLNGSEQLLFTPVGKVTTVSMHSSWPHPSFTGNILPQTTQVRDSGFTATCNSLAHKRNFPQQWIDDTYTVGVVHASSRTTDVAGNFINRAAFGTDLFIPVNDYQKTMRSVKYAVLCILLTFTAFFLIETTNGKSVHPFQYGLIGLALVLFYTLLLSFSEYIGFNPAYAVASLCTIGLIAWFVKGLLSSAKLSTVLTAILVLMYTYIFTLLQLQDYALLLGSVGLFITLAVIMYFSRRMQW
ncbi:MAG: cell envelope integrity protein CreD [Flavisolibacter sp.]|nr:cell envelope integrity protein CreD [Flavisolibacter sp.]